MGQKSTFDILVEKYGNRYVNLETVAPDYFGVNNRARMRKMANAGEFGGVKPFRMSPSNKAPFMVDLQNLADELDKRSRAARS